ncbi:MAG: GIY-YIG nuclease family protein [Romboutsia sp.]|nr:GIY-YIG nuclease family protein [Romboutsia sp.]
MKTHYVYKTTNLINGMIYIGRRSTSKVIEKDFYKGSGVYLKNAFKFFGKQNFKKEILEVCSSFEELLIREVYWINKYNSTNSKLGYNLSNKSIGAGIGVENSFYGKTHTDETKTKISQANKGRKHDKELVNRLTDLRKKENLSNETLKKKSESVKGNKNPFFGKTHTEESKNKISNSKKGKKVTNLHKKNIVNALLNRPKLICQYCNKPIGGGKGNLNKHENKCKEHKL